MSNTELSVAMRFKFFLGIVAISACAPGIENVDRHSYAPQQYEDSILIFADNAIPNCDYEEIATIESRKPHRNGPKDKVNEDLRIKAREIGGDAIVNIGEEQRAVTSSYAHEGDSRWSVATWRETVVSGTVIRWSDESCSN
jgi:hypothetical protein